MTCSSLLADAESARQNMHCIKATHPDLAEIRRRDIYPKSGIGEYSGDKATDTIIREYGDRTPISGSGKQYPVAQFSPLDRFAPATPGRFSPHFFPWTGLPVMMFGKPYSWRMIKRRGETC